MEDHRGSQYGPMSAEKKQKEGRQRSKKTSRKRHKKKEQQNKPER